MEYYNNILERIGNTPLIKLNRVNKGLKPQIFAKLESANPGGSVKDRIGYAMIADAEKRGDLKPGGTIIEATSGNTGIGLALAAAVKGYKCVFVVTDKVSDEKINYLRALGSEVIVVSNAVEPDSPEHYVNVAKKIEAETPNSIFIYQYSNPSNPEAHYRTTGPELWRQTDGKITHFVSSIGTGGTISGTSRFLKEKNPAIQTIAADPYGSIFKTYKETGKLTKGSAYLVEGIGQDCLPKNVHFQYIDKIINVSDKESFAAARLLTKEEGIFCGGSAGTNVHVALKIAEGLTEEDVIVFIVPDTGERYLSKIYNVEWLRQNRLLDAAAKTARDISLNKKYNGYDEIYFVRENNKVVDAVKLLNDKGITQLPVFDKNFEPVGGIKESELLKKILEDNSLLNADVSQVMEEPYPTVDIDADISEVKRIMREKGAALVLDFGRATDFITLYDLIDFEEGE